MAKILSIITENNDDKGILRKKSKRITKITDYIKELANNMFVTMKESGGVGLAAPQVGVNKRIITFDCTEITGNDKDYGTLVNPKILSTQGLVEYDWEGCLSVPDYEANVKRAKEITVEFIDIKDGKKYIKSYGGIPARIIQHEIDHLEGFLLTDFALDLKAI